MSSKIFKQTLEEVGRFSKMHHLIPKNEPLAVAVSGGSDSTALLLLLLQLAKERGTSLHVLHFDHRLQSVSRYHARFVAELCRKFSLPYHLGRWTFREEMGDASELPHGQDNARKARYAFFKSMTAELGIRFLALAHQADDQVETFIWRLLRGAAPSSLAGMRAKSKFRGLTLVRPLLTTSRDRIEDFLHALGVQPCDDPSNLTTHYLRNRIRLELLPLLEKNYQPRLREQIAKMAATIGREHDYLEQLLTKWLKEHVVLLTQQRTFSRRALLACPEGLRFRLFMRILKKIKGSSLAEIKQVHLQAMEQMLLQGGQSCLALPSGWSMSLRGNAVVFEPVAHHSPLDRVGLAKKPRFR